MEIRRFGFWPDFQARWKEWKTRFGFLSFPRFPRGVISTALFHLVVLGAQRPNQGVVRLEGVPLHTLSASARARSLTMVAHPRTPDFALTVRDVVGLGRIPHEALFGVPRPRDAAAIARALEQTATTELADRDLATLSSGELQRVHLARAFAQEAKALLEELGG